MLDIKKILKGITIKNGASTASASTKQFTLTVSDSAAINTTTTLVSAQTANRTITLPDADGTLLTSLVLAPDSVVITDSNGALSTSDITIDELEALDGVTGVIETRLDDLETSVATLETDPVTKTYVDTHLGGLVFDQTGAVINDVVTYDGTKFVLEPGAASGANTTLSNLVAPTAINEDLLFAHLIGGGVAVRAIKTANDTNATNQLQLFSGNSTSSFSGDITMQTGTGESTGLMTLGSGAASTATSGSVFVKSGTASTFSGNVTIGSGDSAFSSGNVIIQTGTGSIRGTVTVNATSLSMSNTRIVSLATPVGTTDATNKTYVDSNLGGFTFDQTGAAATNVITWSGSQYELSDGTPILDVTAVSGVASTISIAAGGAIGPFVNGLYDPNGHWDVGLGDSTFSFTDPGIYEINFTALATAATINANSFFVVLIFDGAVSTSYPIAHVNTLNFYTGGTVLVPVPSVTGSGQITIRWNNSASSNVTVGARRVSIKKVSNI